MIDFSLLPASRFLVMLSIVYSAFLSARCFLLLVRGEIIIHHCLFRRGREVTIIIDDCSCLVACSPPPYYYGLLCEDCFIFVHHLHLRYLLSIAIFIFIWWIYAEPSEHIQLCQSSRVLKAEKWDNMAAAHAKWCQIYDLWRRFMHETLQQQ